MHPNVSGRDCRQGKLLGIASGEEPFHGPVVGAASMPAAEFSEEKLFPGETGRIAGVGDDSGDIPTSG